MLGVAVPLRIQNAADFAHALVGGDAGMAIVAKADLTGFELADVSDAATLGGHLPAYFLPAASFNPAAFEAAGAVATGIAAHVALADPHTQYALEAALGTAASLNVGTGANNVVQLTAASKLPAVDGSLLTNLVALSPTGATTGATSQIQRFDYGVHASVFRGIGTSQPGMIRTDSYLEYQSPNGATLYWDIRNDGIPRFFLQAAFIGGLATSTIAPFSNNVNVPRFTNTAGNAAFLCDTTNLRVGIGSDAFPTAAADIVASTAARASLRLRHGVAPTSPNDGDEWTTTAGKFSRINGVTKTIVMVSSPATYTPTNVTTDRAYDANATTLDEVADVLGTLIADLKLTGIIL